MRKPRSSSSSRRSRPTRTPSSRSAHLTGVTWRARGRSYHQFFQFCHCLRPAGGDGGTPPILQLMSTDIWTWVSSSNPQDQAGILRDKGHGRVVRRPPGQGMEQYPGSIPVTNSAFSRGRHMSLPAIWANSMANGNTSDMGCQIFRIEGEDSIVRAMGLYARNARVMEERGRESVARPFRRTLKGECRSPPQARNAPIYLQKATVILSAFT